MKLPHWVTLLIVALLLTNLLTAGVLVFALRQERIQWRTQMYGMAWYAATLQAAGDYDSGNMRLLEAAEGGGIEFTGRSEGPFEVWTWPSYPELQFPGLSRPVEYTTERFVASYNRHMRKMHEAHLKDVQPDAEQAAPADVEDAAAEP